MKRLLAIGIMGIALSWGGGARADTVKVGLIMPFSGSYAQWGVETKGGVEVYQQLHGKSVNGTNIEIVYRDEGGIDPARAKQLATELILRDHVQFLTGFVFSPDALATADIITQAKMPTIITNAATGFIVRKSPYFVRVSFTLQQESAPLGTWAAAHGIKTVDSVIADYISGQDSNAGFVKAYTAGGGKVLETIKYPTTIADITPYYERVLQDKPQDIYVFGTGGTNSLMMVKTWAARLRPEHIGFIGATQVQESDLPSMGDAAIGLVSSTHYPEHGDNPINKALWTQWFKDYGPHPAAVPDIATCSVYDSMELIYRAVAKFGPHVTGDQAIGFYKGITIPSPRGSITIDPKTRDVIQNIYIERVEMKDGKLQNVPFDVVKDVKDPWKEEHPE
ncbi:MAG TPA: ABC transporter substrate-binding protein [Stellaceae bacterium]|jgi:branched-chain amino acid transport system substrate-binding protein|nr:ABC transporter substrate-binding protein [Stellaceae bacterium]